MKRQNCAAGLIASPCGKWRTHLVQSTASTGAHCAAWEEGHARGRQGGRPNGSWGQVYRLCVVPDAVNLRTIVQAAAGVLQAKCADYAAYHHKVKGAGSSCAVALCADHAAHHHK
eukprot:scaffold41401_cov24-Tisochrysis_lutea.AAC.1